MSRHLSRHRSILRSSGLLVLALSLLCFASGTLRGCTTTPTPTPKPPESKGSQLYNTYCALCHGKKGEGYAADGANALNHPYFLALTDDAFMDRAIKEGRPGTTMSAWGKTYGGPLSDADVVEIRKWIRRWNKQPPLKVHDKKIEGNATRAKALYEFHCASCHGDKGQGGTFMSLNNPVFLAQASDGFLQHSIAEGRPGTPMPAFKSTLTPQGIDDIVTLIRSWAKPPPPPNPNLPSKTLKPLMPFPKGSKADFSADIKDIYIKMAKIKAAYDAKQAFVIIDARPPADYATSHIAGAVSVPFYAATTYIDQLPKDIWIIAYCGCPHAESGSATRALRSKGYTKVGVLDEGFNAWKKAGHPLTTGPKP